MLFRVQSMLPAPAVSLVLLTLLALGMFLAGVAFLSAQICFLGLATALAVPAIAWLCYAGFSSTGDGNGVARGRKACQPASVTVAIW
jgi:hypothetical protein